MEPLCYNRLVFKSSLIVSLDICEKFCSLGRYCLDFLEDLDCLDVLENLDILEKSFLKEVFG